MSEEHSYFTLVFKGDISAFPKNPLKVETPFGVPVACGTGDAFKRIDDLEQRIDDINSNDE